MCELRALILGTVALNRGLCLLVPHRLALTNAFVLRKQEVKHFLNTVAPCYDTLVASIRSRFGRNDNSCLVNPLLMSLRYSHVRIRTFLQKQKVE